MIGMSKKKRENRGIFTYKAINNLNPKNPPHHLDQNKIHIYLGMVYKKCSRYKGHRKWVKKRREREREPNQNRRMGRRI